MSKNPAPVDALTTLESGEICAAMVESDPDALYFRDLDGICRVANPQCVRVLGAEPGELAGARIVQFFPPRFACLVLRQEEAVLADGTERGCELALGRGEMHPCWISHTAVYNGSGEIAGVVGRIRDLGVVKRLERGIVEASEREMRRIACDLHDELCQELAAASLIAKLLQKRLADEDEAQAKVAAHISDLTRQMALKTRAIIYNLAPEPLAGEPFLAGLREIATHLCSAYSVKCGIEGNWPGELRDEAAAIQLYRIAHEAMHNAARHSGGSCITVRLRHADGVFALSVADNGNGIPAECSSGLGLSSMRYRAGLIGAELVIESALDAGTCVVCKLPLE